MRPRTYALALLAFLLAACGPPSIELPEPASTEWPTRDAFAGRQLEWLRAGRDGLTGADIETIGSVRGTLVVAGSREFVAAIWWSDDGDRWHLVPGDFDEGALGAIVPTADGLMAIGHRSAGLSGLDSDPVAWASPDGKEWTRIGNIRCPGTDTLEAAAAAREGWIFVGGHRPQVCIAATGSIAADPLSGIAPMWSLHPNGIAAKGDALVIVGTTAWTNETWTDDYVAATWLSTDGGRTWAESRVQPSAATLRAVASDNRRLFAVGTDPHETGETVVIDGEPVANFLELPLLLASLDGARWESSWLTSPDIPGGANDILYAGGGFVAVGWSLGQAPATTWSKDASQPIAWTSADGLVWTASQIPARGEEAEHIARWGDRLAVLTTDDSVLTNDSIWLTTP